MDDYLAKLNIEGARNTWRENRKKIDFVFKKIKKYLKPRLSACDIGVGEGYLLTRLYKAKLKVTGIDISSYVINYLQKKFRKQGLDIKLIQGDFSKINLENNQFDLVTCFDVLEHIEGEGLNLGIEILKKCIKNNGLLIGTLPLGENLVKNMAICPKCGHKFHRVGHFHSLKNINEINELLQPEFRIIQTGEIPINIFKSNILNSVISFFTKYTRKLIPISESKTVYFIARLYKS